MYIFKDVLLDEEVRPIHQSGLPDHTTVLSLIIHTEKTDYYPDKIIELDTVSDYVENISDKLITSLLMGGGDFNQLIYPYRDNLQISTRINYNGKIVETRYKAILLNRQNDTIGAKHSNMDILEIKFQLVNLVYSVTRLKTVNGVINNTLDKILRHYLDKELSSINIDGRVVNPIIDIVPINNDRVYSNVIIKDNIKLIDLPLYFQQKYGIYNGGLGTYIYKDINGKDVISVYPVYNSLIQDDKRMKLIIYLPDADEASLINKTAIIRNNELQVIVTKNFKYSDIGDSKLFDQGAGFKTVNSNQVIDRVYEKKDGVITSTKDAMVDTQSIKNTADGLPMASHNGITDNLYAVRTKFIYNNSKKLQCQWNYSRPDYLYPGMPVEVVHYKDGIIRETGVLMSAGSNINNNSKVSTTLLNVIINGKVE